MQKLFNVDAGKNVWNKKNYTYVIIVKVKLKIKVAKIKIVKNKQENIEVFYN